MYIIFNILVLTMLAAGVALCIVTDINAKLTMAFIMLTILVVIVVLLVTGAAFGIDTEILAKITPLAAIILLTSFIIRVKLDGK